MKTLKKFITETFDLKLESLLPDGLDLIALSGKDLDDAYLVGSEAARGNAFLVQADLDRFILDAPQGYFLLGHWGHGANSYALYYSRVDEWSRVLFRLSYGGIYMDNEANARRIHDYLLAFQKFERKLKSEARELIAVHSVGYEYFRLEMKNGRVAERRDPLFAAMDPAVFDELHHACRRDD